MTVFLMGVYRTLRVIRRIFNSIHCGRLKSLICLGQFLYTFLVGVSRRREPLCVAGLTGTI
jgi:hypothetical protein